MPDNDEQMTRLQRVLEGLRRANIDDEQVALNEEARRLAAAQERAGQVADMLRRENVELTPDVYPEILRVGPAQRGRLRLRMGTSLGAVRDWLQPNAGQQMPATVVLSGGTGCGKSVAAAYACAWQLHGVMWRSAARLARVFAASFGEQFEEQERLCNCRLLVIDDAGLETDSARFHSALHELLERRGKDVRRKRTVITTNLKPEALFALYDNDPRLVSRFAPHLVAWFQDAGPDLRRRK